MMLRPDPALTYRPPTSDEYLLADAIHALRLLIGEAHWSPEDGAWRIGPLADPSTPDGAGGTLAYARTVLARADASRSR